MKDKKRLKILFLILCFLFTLPLRSQSHRDYEIVSVEKTAEIIEKLASLNLDLLWEWKGKIFIHASSRDLYILDKENILYRFETMRFFPPYPVDVLSIDGRNGAYHSYSELEKELKSLEKSHPDLAKIFDLGTSLENRKIYAIKVSDNVSLDEEEAEVAFLGCHHAREWISVEVPFLLAKHLLENYGKSPPLKRIVDSSEIWIVPLVNPDGLEYSIHFYRYWRKNRRDNGDGSYGVDLNRNYGYKWGFDNKGSSNNPQSAVYRGKSPFSEPETQAVQKLFISKKIQAMITYHSFSQLILYPWGYTQTPAEKESLLKELAAQMSTLIQKVHGKLYQFGQAGAALYLTNGDTTDWAYGTFGIPSYTIELPPVDELQGGFFNAEKDIQTVFEENLPAMLCLIEWSIENFIPKQSPDFILELTNPFLKRKKFQN